MSRRKKVINPLDGRWSTPVIGYETWAQMKARTAREEQEAAAKLKSDAEAATAEAERQANAPILSLQNEFNQNLRELRQIRKDTLYSKPSSELSSRCPKRPNVIEGATAESIAQQVLQAARTGIRVSLSQSGRDKVLAVLRLHGDLDTTNALTWAETFSYIKSLGGFTVEDGVPVEPEPVVEPVTPSPAKRQTLDEVMNENSSLSKDGYQKIKAIVDRDVYEEWADTFNYFTDACRDQFGSPLTQEEARSLGRMVINRNLNPRLLHSWSQARELCVRAGFLRPIYHTPDEALAFDVERGIVKTGTHEERQAFNRKVNSIHGKVALLS